MWNFPEREELAVAAPVAACVSGGCEVDEDAEFESRAYEHLDVWCAPLDSDVLEPNSPCGTGRLDMDSSVVLHPAETATAQPTSHQQTWTGGAACCHNLDVSAEEMLANSPDMQKSAPLSDAVQKRMRNRGEGQLWTASGDLQHRGIRNDAHAREQEALKRTKEWATLFQEGWLLASGQKGQDPALPEADGCTGGTRRIADQESHRTDMVSVNFSSSSPLNCVHGDSRGTLKTQGESEGDGHTNFSDSEVVMWTAPRDEEEEDLANQEQSDSWETGISAKFDEWEAIHAHKRNDVADFQPDKTGVCTSTKCSGGEHQEMTVAAVLTVDSVASARQTKLPEALASSRQRAEEGVGGSGRSTVKTFIQKMKRSPGGLPSRNERHKKERATVDEARCACCLVDFQLACVPHLPATGLADVRKGG